MPRTISTHAIAQQQCFDNGVYTLNNDNDNGNHTYEHALSKTFATTECSVQTAKGVPQKTAIMSNGVINKDCIGSVAACTYPSRLRSARRYSVGESGCIIRPSACLRARAKQHLCRLRSLRRTDWPRCQL